MFLFAAIVLFVSYSGYAQDLPKFEGSTEDAIGIVRNSYFVPMLTYAADTLLNIDRFIREVDKIVPVDRQKKGQLEIQLLSVLQKKEGYSMDWSLIYWPLGRAPFVGSNVDAVLKDNFSSSEYEKLSEQLSKNLITTISAYQFLFYLQKEELEKQDYFIIGFPDNPRLIKGVYDYFDI